jgi:hypothetical protein
MCLIAISSAKIRISLLKIPLLFRKIYLPLVSPKLLHLGIKKERILFVLLSIFRNFAAKNGNNCQNGRYLKKVCQLPVPEWQLAESDSNGQHAD